MPQMQSGGVSKAHNWDSRKEGGGGFDAFGRGSSVATKAPQLPVAPVAPAAPMPAPGSNVSPLHQGLFFPRLAGGSSLPGVQLRPLQPSTTAGQVALQGTQMPFLGSYGTLSPLVQQFLQTLPRMQMPQSFGAAIGG